MSAAEQEIEVLTIAAMARDAEWLNADACAFLLGMRNRKGEVNRRGFLERVAVKSSFPRASFIAGGKRWKRVDVARWAEDEAKINRAA